MDQLFILLIFSIFTSFSATAETKIATFAGGCFWCMEPPFEKQEGVIRAVSGYTGGSEKDPVYKQVARGKTGHREAVQITFDPKKISYNDLLEIFWRSIDPTDAGGQFVDRGKQYASGIFYHNEEQKKLALASKKNIIASKRFKSQIVTPLFKANEFYPAEEYHQDYYKKNPIRYNFYRYNSGRDQFIDKHWGKERNYKVPKSVIRS